MQKKAKEKKNGNSNEQILMLLSIPSSSGPATHRSPFLPLPNTQDHEQICSTTILVLLLQAFSPILGILVRVVRIECGHHSLNLRS